MSEIPTNWTTKRLDEVAKVTMGQSPPGSSYNSSGEGIPFFQGKAEFGIKHPTIKKWTTAGTKFADAGDILMSVRAPVGPTNIADVDCAIGRGLAAIKADPDQILQTYLLWFLKHIQSSIESRGKGSTFDAISGNELRETILNLPSLDGQQRIVESLEEHLSRLDKLAEFVSFSRVELTNQRRALLRDSFSVDLAHISEHQLLKSPGQLLSFDEAFEVIRPKQDALKQREYLNEGRFPVIDQGAELIGGFSNDESLVVDRKLPLIVFGDHTRIVKWIDFKFVVGADGTKILEPKNRLDQRFAYYQLMSKELQSKGYARHFSLLRKESFWAPPLDHQQFILENLENHLNRLDKAGAEFTNIDLKVQTMRRSLLHSAFTGRLIK